MSLTRFHIFVFACLWLASLLVAGRAHAFAPTEDELMQAEIHEARARASDWKNYLRTVRERQAKADQGAAEVKKERARSEAEAEAARQAFIRERDRRPTNDAEQARLEREDDIIKRREAERYEQDRLKYLAKRRHVREIIEREGTIDENQEYGL